MSDLGPKVWNSLPLIIKSFLSLICLRLTLGPISLLWPFNSHHKNMAGCTVFISYLFSVKCWCVFIDNYSCKILYTQHKKTLVCTGKSKELIAYMRRMMVDLHKSWMSLGAISKQLQIPRSVVVSSNKSQIVLLSWEEIGSVGQAPPSQKSTINWLLLKHQSHCLQPSMFYNPKNWKASVQERSPRSKTFKLD